MKAIVSLLLCLYCLAGIAQRGRQLTPIYIPGTAYKNTGWFISPGITYMLPEDRKQGLTTYNGAADNMDTLYSGNFVRKGKIGFYLEAGRHKFISDRSIIDHIDYGIHFKMLRGVENFTGVTNNGVGMTPVESNSTFSESFAGAFINASNILQLSSNTWIQNSLGVNADFRVISNRNAGVAYGADWNFPNPLLAQLHYKIGFGWKPEAGIYIIPMLETPILTAYPWDNGKSTLQYFVGRDRPLILTIRIQWLSKEKDRTCEGQPGKGPKSVDKDKPGKHEKSNLWGPDGKKMRH